MLGYIFLAAFWGSLFTGITGFLAGICLSLYWVGIHDGFVLMLMFWAPAVGLAGLIIGFFLFLIVGLIISLFEDLKNSPVISFSVLGVFFSLFPLLVFCSVGVGINPVLALIGNKGSYLVLVPGLIAATLAGILTGQKFEKYSR